MTKRNTSTLIFVAALSLLLGACANAEEPNARKPIANTKGINKETKPMTTSEEKKNSDKQSDSYWKEKLDAHTYDITRCSGTEAPFTGKYWNNHEEGIYRCSNCGEVLFSSKDKFDSGTGWPSFTQAQGSAVDTRVDSSHGMTRDEIICKHCGAHLGHVFEDGPAPTGQRFCVNSASLDFKAKDKE